MKIVRLRHDYQEWASQLRGKHPDASHFDKTIDEDAVILALDNSIIAVLLKNCIAPKLRKRAYRMRKFLKQIPSNRISAVGSRSLPKLKKDGTLSSRRAVAQSVVKILKKEGVRQGMLGYVDATPDAPCHKTRLTEKRPELLHQNKKLIKRVNRLYAQYLPKLHATQWAEVQDRPCWRLWDTVFTTVYFVKQLRCGYHRDSGNLHGVMSVIMPMGKFTGGYLVFPRFRFAVAYRPGDLLFLNPQQLHGNLPFKGRRAAAIFYCEGRIRKCDKFGPGIMRFPRCA
jgi:hypothetical protein